MNAVIFDMDGVLIDSERVVLEGFRYAGKKTGVPNAERMAIMGLGLNDDAWIEKLRLEFGADAMRVLEYAEAYMAKFYAESAAPAKKRRAAAACATARVEDPDCGRVLLTGRRGARLSSSRTNAAIACCAITPETSPPESFAENRLRSRRIPCGVWMYFPLSARLTVEACRPTACAISCIVIGASGCRERKYGICRFRIS